MNDFPFWVLIPVVAIIGWVIVSTTSMARGRRRTNDDQVSTALTQATETNRLLSERIDQLDRRLASIEKTLNDIP